MMKKLQLLSLCTLIAFSMSACGDTRPQSQQETEQNETEQKDTDSPEPLLGPDSTDEELLELLHDDINVVTDEDYIEMIEAFKTDTEQYSGKIYQIEGIYTLENDVPYLNRTVADGDSKNASGLPLKYVPEGQEPEEGSWIRVTGVINEGEIEGETVAVLEMVVLEKPDKEGQAELSVN